MAQIHTYIPDSVSWPRLPNDIWACIVEHVWDDFICKPILRERGYKQHLVGFRLEPRVDDPAEMVVVAPCHGQVLRVNSLFHKIGKPILRRFALDDSRLVLTHSLLDIQVVVQFPKHLFYIEREISKTTLPRSLILHAMPWCGYNDQWYQTDMIRHLTFRTQLQRVVASLPPGEVVWFMAEPEATLIENESLDTLEFYRELFMALLNGRIRHIIFTVPQHDEVNWNAMWWHYKERGQEFIWENAAALRQSLSLLINSDDLSDVDVVIEEEPLLSVFHVGLPNTLSGSIAEWEREHRA